MNEKDCEQEPKKGKNWGTGGGMYRGVKASVKTLNYVIVVLVALLVIVVIYLASTSSYKVTYETNGGEAIAVENYKYGDTMDLKTPTKTGYVFVDWFIDQDLTKVWDNQHDIVEESMTLYAKWTPAQIHILLDINGGSVDSQASLAKDIPFHEPYGELPIPTKEGKTFVGWQYNGAYIQSDTIVTMNGEHTLKAIFE